MSEKTYTMKEATSRNITDDFKMFDEEGNTNFYIKPCIECGGSYAGGYEVFMGRKTFGYYKTTTACKIAVTKTFAQDENGNGLIPRDEIKFIIVNIVADYSEDFETTEEFVEAINKKLEYYAQDEAFDRCAEMLREWAYYNGESFSTLSLLFGEHEEERPLTEVEKMGIRACHSILNSVEEYRLSHGAREQGASEEDLLGIIEEDIAYLEELRETLDDIRSEMPVHTFKRMTIRGEETFTMLNSEAVSSAFMSAGIKVNFHLDNRKGWFDYKVRKFIKLC